MAARTERHTHHMHHHCAPPHAGKHHNATLKTVASTFTAPTMSPPKPIDAPEMPLKHVFMNVQREYDGEDMKGVGVASYVMSYLPDAHTMPYTGQQVFHGTLFGRSGAVAMHTEGVYTAKGLDAKWTILPDTATGELKGIHGHGKYTVTDSKFDDPVPFTLTVEMPAE